MPQPTPPTDDTACTSTDCAVTLADETVALAAPEASAYLVAAAPKQHATETDYRRLLAEIDVVAERLGGIHLTDECIDAENVGPWEDSAVDAEYYDRMIRAACMAAGQRAEDAGIDLNQEMGRAIY